MAAPVCCYERHPCVTWLFANLLTAGALRLRILKIEVVMLSSEQVFCLPTAANFWSVKRSEEKDPHIRMSRWLAPSNPGPTRDRSNLPQRQPPFFPPEQTRPPQRPLAGQP